LNPFVRNRRYSVVATLGAILACLTGFCEVAHAISIGEARQKPIGAGVNLENKVVTKCLSGRFYVEEPNRSAGIAVIQAGRTYAAGTVITISGNVAQTLEGETVIDTAVDTATGEVTPLVPLGITNSATQLKLTEGLLVEVAGAVVGSRLGGSTFRIDDGSGLLDDFGNTGLRCRYEIGTPPVNTGYFVKVRGVRGKIQASNGNVPVIYLTDPGDITIAVP